jgi:hypothetical protein
LNDEELLVACWFRTKIGNFFKDGDDDEHAREKRERLLLMFWREGRERI